MIMLLKETNPQRNLVSLSIYETKKLVLKLYLGYKIVTLMDVCCIIKVMKMRSVVNFVVHINTRNLEGKGKILRCGFQENVLSYHSYQGFSDYMLLLAWLNI